MPNVSILTPIVERNTTMPVSFAAGSNRLLIYTVHCQSSGSPVPPTSVTCNGITRTHFAGDTSSQLRVTSTSFLFLESELATIVNQAVTITGATATLIKSTVQLLQDAEQATPTNVVSVRGTGGGNLNLSLTRSSNSLTTLYSLCQNVNYTATLANPSGTGMIQVGGAVALTHGSMADSAGTVVATSSTQAGSQQTAIAINFKSAIQQSASINGGNPVKVGQTGITAALTGFTTIPTSVTCAYGSGQSLTCSNIQGNASAITFDIEDRAQGVDYPAIGDGLTFTITNGAETTVPTSSLAAKTGETVVAPFAASIDYWDTYFAYWWKQAGYITDNSEFVFTTSGFSPSDFVLRTDSGFSSTSGGVVTGWFRPASGTGAGNVYYYEFTVNGGAIITSRGNNHYIGLGLGIGF